MNSTSLQTTASEILKFAGINVNGSNPWDIQIFNSDFYSRVFKYGSLGLGEAYMDQWWECERLDEFFEKVIKSDLETKVISNKWTALKIAFYKIINMQSKKRSLEVGQKHYDLGNDLYQSMLDTRMNYTCGYWKNATNLDDAQRDKLELTCQKMQLQPGMRVLDIGCGFGALAKYAAENYGVSVVGVTISKEQQEYAINNCANLSVEIRFQDYRDVNEKFDRVVSLGMFEHVGFKNYRTYMKVAHRCLKDSGLFLLHSIGSNLTTLNCDKWISKYIFPNSSLPSAAQIAKASEGLFIMEDWHNFGADYDKTLMAWYENVTRHKDKLKNLYDERFFRMWRYYLLSCAGMFRARNAQLWQIVFSKQGVPGGYQATRL